MGEARDFTSGEEGAKVGVNQMPVCGFEFEETETKHFFLKHLFFRLSTSHLIRS